jgi:hypothetical protein
MNTAIVHEETDRQGHQLVALCHKPISTTGLLISMALVACFGVNCNTAGFEPRQDGLSCGLELETMQDLRADRQSVLEQATANPGESLKLCAWMPCFCYISPQSPWEAAVWPDFPEGGFDPPELWFEYVADKGKQEMAGVLCELDRMGAELLEINGFSQFVRFRIESPAAVQMAREWPAEILLESCEVDLTPEFLDSVNGI